MVREIGFPGMGREGIHERGEIPSPFHLVHLGWKTDSQQGEEMVPMAVNSCQVRMKTLASTALASPV